MSYLNINNRLLNESVDIQRASTIKDAYGGLTESWITVYNEIIATIQEVDNKRIITEIGEEVTRTHIGFFQRKNNGSNLVLSEGDKIIRKNFGLIYRVIGVGRSLNAQGEIHHFEVQLECLGQQATISQQVDILSKAKITKNG